MKSKNSLFKKPVLLATLTMLVATVAQAADEANAAAQNAKTQELNNTLLWVVVGIIAVLAITTAIIVMRTMRIYQDIVVTSIAKEQGRNPVNVLKEYRETQEADVLGGFKRFWDNAVPVEKEKDILIDHPHDGIYELDNRLPPWWLYGFYATIVFSVFYIGYYHFSKEERGQAQEYKVAMREGEAIRRIAQEREEAKINESNVTAAVDAKTIESGKNIFIAKCVACHGKAGEGTVGPNLTDEFWLHGGGIKNVFRTVKEGVPAKGMISWKNQLPAGDIRAVASYILTLKGTNPANPKAPQGEKYVETETEAPADTAKLKTATATVPQ